MWTIKTYFYNHKNEVVRVNSSKNANVATENALKFMAVGMYSTATVAQVVDGDTGEVHSEVVLRRNGKIEITYVRDPRNYEKRIHLDSWQAELDERSKQNE